MSKKKDATVETVEVEEKAEQKPQETAKAETAQAEPETYVLTAEEMKTARERIESLQREKEETVALLQRNQADFDIHDRVNYAVVNSVLSVSSEEKTITLDITLDDAICSVLDYFEIFLERMLMCRRAAEMLGCRFSLLANGGRVL